MSDARNGDELDEAGDVGVSAEDLEFFAELAVDVVEVAAGLEAGVVKATEEGLVVAALPVGGRYVVGKKKRDRKVQDKGR